MNQKKKFVLTVTGNKIKPSTTKRLSLVWTDGVHRVRSPTVIYTTPDEERAIYSVSGGEGASAQSMLYIAFIFIVLIMMPLYQVQYHCFLIII
ncbi:putative subtilisin-like protease, fibronectin type-III domain-containing protein [Helianthus annuus]|nr:putative subtilisin-like protease, fibronectin type-III domain-containing protein [Helianthus annuus]